MQPDSNTIILALALFALKHFIADFVLQSNWMVQGKGRYGHPGGLAHAAIHMAGSVPALLVLGAPPGVLVALVLFEGLVHYHIDFSKEVIARRLSVGPSDKAFWVLLGGDQFLHHATYLAMVVVMLRAVV